MVYNLEYQRKWKLKNKEKIKEYNLINKEKIAQTQKNWRLKNIEILNKKSEENYTKNPTNDMFYKAKRRAKKKNIPFNIDKEYLKSIYPKDNICPVLNIPFQLGYFNENKKNSDFSPSVDRIIPEKGYVKGNLMIICNIVNRVKNNASFEMLEKIFNFYKKLNEK